MQFYKTLFEKLKMKKGTYNHFLGFITRYNWKKEMKQKRDDILDH